MKKTLKLSLLISGFWLIASCSTSQLVTPHQPVTEGHSPSLTTPILETEIPGATLPIAIASKTTTQTPVVSSVETLPSNISDTHRTSESNESTSVYSSEPIHRKCLNITDKLPKGNSVRGVIVYQTDATGDLALDEAVLWNLEKELEFHLDLEPREIQSGFEVSQNRDRLLYFRLSNTRSITIVTADGKLLSSLQVPSSAGVIGLKWLDNERLILDDLTIDVEDGLTQTLESDFPDNVVGTSILGDLKWDSGRVLIYDPTLSRVLYPECNADCQDDFGNINGRPVTLWNLETNEAVTRLMTTDYYGGTPIWMTNGEKAFMAIDPYPMKDHRGNFVNGDEFFSIGRDGQIQQLTFFHDNFDWAEIINDYSLSPNDRYLAFWLVAKNDDLEWMRADDDLLTILDTRTGEVVNLCLSGDPFRINDLSTVGTTPIWSPDSTQLLIVDRDPNDETRRRVILVDIVNNYAAVIAENVEPVGWMVAP